MATHPVFLPGESHGQKSLVEEPIELGTTEAIYRAPIPIFQSIFTLIKSTKNIGNKVLKTVADVIFLGSKITADGDCSHKIKRCFSKEKL